MAFLDEEGLAAALTKLKDEFSLASHTHDDTYYTKAEIDEKIGDIISMMDVLTELREL